MVPKLLSLKVRLIALGVIVLAGASAALLVFVGLIVIGASGASATECAPANTVPTAPKDAATEQIANAQIIDKTAKSLGLSGAATRIAIIAAIGESSLVNLGYGDEGRGVKNPDGSSTDSKGLFQQQPSQGWGTIEQVMDPEYATTSFLIGKHHDRQSGLVSIPDWETIEPTVAIHKVQINADPNHYARYYSQADKIISDAGIDVTRAAVGGPRSAPGGANISSGTTCAPVAGAGAGSAGQAALPLDQPFNMTDNYGPRPVPVRGASSWHPAVDLVGQCGAPIYAILPGTVTASDRLALTVTSPDGFTVSYLHSHKKDRSVDIGQTVTTGQQISLVGDESPATGCHLDLRINVAGNTNPNVASLPVSSVVPGYVDPEAFMRLYGIELCPADWCKRQYSE